MSGQVYEYGAIETSLHRRFAEYGIPRQDMSDLSPICDTIASWLNQRTPSDPAWSDIQWKSFRWVCRVHGVAPLLHQKVGGCSWLVEDTRQWLVEQFSFNQQRIAKIHEELQAVLAQFAAEGIPLMPLKGAILSLNYYDMPGMRPMADLDLLIQPQDLAHSQRLLQALGYASATAHWKHTEFIKPDNRRVVSKEVEHPDNPRGIELHLYCRETFGGPTLDLTDLMWGNALPGMLLGKATRLPQVEALWLHLLVHATYHMWQGKGRLIHLFDLVRLTPHVADPHPFLNAIEARYTYPALALFDKYFPGHLPGPILVSQSERVSSAFRDWVAGLDLVNTSYLNPAPAGLYLGKALRFSEGRPLEVAQALRFALIPSLSEIALDHPRLAASKLPWLAYFLLPVDWFRRLTR